MIVRWLGRQPYLPVAQAMQAFTESRTEGTPDELWVVEHEPVYTLGLTGRAEQVLQAAGVPVVNTNRGGQVTYHGPGQVVLYPLLNLRRHGIFVKEYVYRIEASLLQTLAHWGLTGHRVPTAPGVYVDTDNPRAHARRTPAAQAPTASPFAGLSKIAALGVKVSRHGTYHGVALNVHMDLAPFTRMHPCGYPGLHTTDMASCGVDVTWQAVAERWVELFQAHFPSLEPPGPPGGQSGS